MVLLIALQMMVKMSALGVQLFLPLALVGLLVRKC